LRLFGSGRWDAEKLKAEEDNKEVAESKVIDLIQIEPDPAPSSPSFTDARIPEVMGISSTLTPRISKMADPRSTSPSEERGLGRVVWSRTAWESWVGHPT
jgi:hypothetical protein